MKKSGKPSLGKPSALDSQPGTSKDALKQMPQAPLSKETSNVSLEGEMTSLSKEFFSTWRDIRWFQIPLSSLRQPKAGLFSFTFQSSLQKYQQLRKTKRLKVGRPFSVLPLHTLTVPLKDHPSFRDALRDDNHRTSRTDRTKVRKRLSAHKNDSRSFLRRMKKKTFQKHQPSPEVLPPKCVSPSAAVSGPQWVTGLGKRSRKESKKEGTGPPAKIPGRAKGSGERNDWESPLEEEVDESLFPPDWSPPSFLFRKDTPSISPDPGPGSESGSSQEMADGTEAPESAEKLEEEEDSVSPAETLGRDDGFDMQSDPSSPLKEAEEGEGASFLPDSPLKRIVLADNEEPPPLSPIPGPSESQGSWEMLDQEAGESPRSLSPTLHLLLPGFGNSSSSSLSGSFEGFSEGAEELTPDSSEEEDMDDSSLLPLRDLLQMDESSSSTMETNVDALPRRDSYLDSLDKLLEEKRKQMREEEDLQRSLENDLLFLKWSSAGESSEDNEPSLLDTQRLVLERFSISTGSIPIVHPGENIFSPPSSPRSAFALDIAGLEPQNQLESLLFSSSSSTYQRLAIVQSGSLGFIYHGIAKCPLPVLRWLFQLMSLNPDASRDAFQTLWNIGTYQNISSADAGLWCPQLEDIAQAFYNFGACTSTLFPAGLVQCEFILEILEFPEYSCLADLQNDNYFQLNFIPMMEDMFKFLTLCVTTQPLCYPDQQRLAITSLLCRVSLDRNLRKQPLIDLQQLVLVLLEGIEKWEESLPELCRSLNHVSQHHHNMVSVVRCFPDTTARGGQLRRILSLSFIMKLLGSMKMPPDFWQEEIQLQQLCELLPLMRPASLKQTLQQTQKIQEEPPENQQKTLDHEACYLCYNLLVLANVVVGTKPASPAEQCHLQQLCLQVQQHICSNLRENPSLLYRTTLKNLAAQTYVKWQELLSQNWLQFTHSQAKSDEV
ncbi:LOW QUALITY PROTEIN: protein FAM178B [Erythrolamprus reginae]|uniref:LOW QUALITY PROTEIN: protein FAM178B n=1 Tax=Erythrolamprus reginae TaxID=121349 RepID=UPI00396C3D97